MTFPDASPAGFLATVAPGTRVVARYRIVGGLTDALGDVVGHDAGSVTIRTRQADVVISLHDVVAAKTVPPAPLSRHPRS